jgi:hypothetical protein
MINKMLYYLYYNNIIIVLFLKINNLPDGLSNGIDLRNITTTSNFDSDI